MYRHLSTSRGAGNLQTDALAIQPIRVKHPITPSRGRKQASLCFFTKSLMGIATYLPREGPETDCMCNTDVS